MIRCRLARSVVTILSVLPLAVLLGCPPTGGGGGSAGSGGTGGSGGGGSSSTGTVAIAFACELPTQQNSPQDCSRGFSYKVTPAQLTGNAGTKSAVSGSQPNQDQTATTTINGNPAAIFSWVVPGAFAFGTWTLTVSDNTGWNATTPVTMSSGSPTVEVHCDNMSPSCQTGNSNLSTYP